MDKRRRFDPKAIKPQPYEHAFDGGNSNPTSSFKMEEKPKVEKAARQPARARQQTDEVEKNEEGKQQAIQPFPPAPKSPSQTITSRWHPGELEVLKRDPSSYTLRLVTPEVQAAREADFIGDAFYCNLTHGANLPDIGGDYVIVYTRPAGALFDTGYKSAVFSPSMDNVIAISTRFSNIHGYDGKVMEQALNSGHWACGRMQFQGMRSMLALEPLPANVPRCNRNTANAKFQIDTVLEDVYEQGMLSKLDSWDSGAIVSFGLKIMQYDYVDDDDGEKRIYASGFHFVKLEIPFFDEDTKKSQRQLVVAVKIPPGNAPDVSTAFILKQRRFSSRDYAIIEGDPLARDFVDWRNYGITKKYDGHNPPAGWFVPPIERLGIGAQYYFSISTLEQHLLTVVDPLLELKNLMSWLRGFMVHKPRSRADMNLHDLYLYMEGRHDGLRGELDLRLAMGSEKVIMGFVEDAKKRKKREVAQGGKDLGLGGDKFKHDKSEKLPLEEFTSRRRPTYRRARKEKGRLAEEPSE